MKDSIRFGINVSPSAEPGSDPVAFARRAEQLGFDFVSVNDHLHGDAPRHETWTLLSWIAATTNRIGVLPRVLGVPYRNPAVVAKMAETLDRLSGGRLILGLGAGASEEEFGAFGISARATIDGLEDAVRIVRGLWTEERFTYAGRVHRTDAARIEPKPARRIPIWLGTFGPRGLALTGRLADGWIPSYEYALPERIPAMRERIVAAARAAGRDDAEITCVYNMVIRVGASGDREQMIAGRARDVAARLADFLDLGFSAFNVIPDGPGEQAERIALEVVPAVREAALARRR